MPGIRKRKERNKNLHVQTQNSVHPVRDTNSLGKGSKEAGRHRSKYKTGNTHRQAKHKGARTKVGISTNYYENNNGKLTDISTQGITSKRAQVCGRLSRLATDWLTDEAGGVPVGVDGVKAGTGIGAEGCVQEMQRDGGVKKSTELQQSP